MKKIKLLFVLITMISTHTITAQVSINTDGTTPDASAILDLKSTEKGILIPRMTQSEIEDIASPAIGLMVFNTSDNHFYFYDDGAGVWKEIAIGTGTITPTPASWTCGDALVDARDSKSYTTVQIGIQCWMAENMNIGTMINTSNGGTNNDGEQTDNSIFEKYCYDNNTSNCDTYGGLYQWNEMMQYSTTEGIQGICPTGWHLPSDAEWCTLENEVDAGTVSCSAIDWRGTDVGGNLKETGTTHWNSPNSGATNSSGFTALPSGYRSPTGDFNRLNESIYLWSSTENGTSSWRRLIMYNYTQVHRNSNDKTNGEGVRCLKD